MEKYIAPCEDCCWKHNQSGLLQMHSHATNFAAASVFKDYTNVNPEKIKSQTDIKAVFYDIKRPFTMF